MRRTLLAALICTSFLGGCTNWRGNDAQTAAQLQAPFREDQKWWAPFEDPLMDQLTTQLVASNLDIKIAMARIEEARALRRVSASALYPDISGTATASRGTTSFGSTKPERVAQAGFDATWEIDVFGSTRAGVDAATARLGASQANGADIRRIITADLIRAVVDWRQAEQTLLETQNLLDSQSEQVDLFAARQEAGLIDATFLERARAQREQTATQIPLAEAAAKSAQYQIERLVGLKPESLSDLLARSTEPSLSVPQPVSVLDIPLATIRNRPDVRKAAYDLAAARADLRQAEADLWPKLSISSFFGVQDVSEGIKPFTASNPIWSLAGAITAPLLNFGRLQGVIDASDAREKQAALTYENVVLIALQDAHTALSDYLNGVNAVNQQATALRHRQETVALARERFKQGLTDMTDLTTAQAELDQATISLIERKAQAATAYIRFRKALGS